MNAGGGLFYEAAAQLTFPMDEVISASFITLVFNAVGAVYTLLGSSISAAAMNWILAGVCVQAVFPKACFRCACVSWVCFMLILFGNYLLDVWQAALAFVLLACSHSKKTIGG